MVPVAFAVVFWKVAGTFAAALAPRVLPYLGHFSHPKTLTQFSFPQWIESFANFDGIFYLRIAHDGYSQYEQAFFPLVPLLIRAAAPVFGGNLLIAGLTLSFVSFLTGAYYLVQLLRLHGVRNPMTILALLLVFPTSFFFHSLYTESLFFLLAVLTFYFHHKGWKKYAALTASLASATRLVGVFLAIPFVVDAFRALKMEKREVKSAIQALFGALLSSGGLMIYMVYLWHTTGNPLAFADAQTAFGAGRSTSFVPLPQVYYRYGKILLSNGANFATAISLLEVTIFSLVFFTILYDLWKKRSQANPFLSLHLFSLANILFPTISGTFLSIPRFALLSLSFFVILGSVRRRVLLWAPAALFAILHITLLMYFVQGYFVA